MHEFRGSPEEISRAYGKKYPFTLNLVCSDRNGDVFCAHQTSSGLYEIAVEAPCVITNHIINDESIYKLSHRGVNTNLHYKVSKNTARDSRGYIVESRKM